MGSCKHKCITCGKEWVCEFPYFSTHEFFEDAVQIGSYCNAYCPNCYAEERLQMDKLFQNNYETKYFETITRKKKSSKTIDKYQ